MKRLRPWAANGAALRSPKSEDRRSMDIPRALRDDLLTYLFCTSPDGLAFIADLLVRNPGMLIDLEADDELRAKFEIERWAGRPPEPSPDATNPRRRPVFERGDPI